MSTPTENNKRIVKNTLLLYVRMFFILGISLFTSRIVLRTLGIEDFGINNVVGGVVTMMGVVNSAMSVATQRYLTFNLGKADLESLHKTFNVSLTIYIWISFIFFVLAEVVGLWFVNTQLNIPQERMVAANWIFQFSVFSMISTFLLTPYYSTVIAHEHMDFYAYVSIAEALAKLVVVYCLLVMPFDRLITYGALYFCISLSVFALFRYYCIRHFKECHFAFYRDRRMYKEIISYSGWSLFGALAGIAREQGLNILLNIFFSPVVNAARGIASQVNAAASMFFSNFSTATRPQITKYYAQEDYDNMTLLIFRSSKFSFFLLWLVALPILLETPAIIKLWLGQVPDYVVPFTRIIIIITAVDSLSGSIMTLCHATGKIRLYQFTVGIINILVVPISYYILHLGYAPVSVFLVSLVMTVIALIVRLYIAKLLVPAFPLTSFLVRVVMVSLVVGILSACIPLVIFYHCEQNALTAFSVCILSAFSTALVIYVIGINRVEREYLQAVFIKKMLRR